MTNDTHKAWYEGQTEEDASTYAAVDFNDAASQHVDATIDDYDDANETSWESDGVPAVYVKTLETGLITKHDISPTQVTEFVATLSEDNTAGEAHEADETDGDEAEDRAPEDTAAAAA